MKRGFGFAIPAMVAAILLAGCSLLNGDPGPSWAQHEDDFGLDLQVHAGGIMNELGSQPVISTNQSPRAFVPTSAEY